MVIQNQKALDILLAQQRVALALKHEKCCFYINKSGTILSGMRDLKKVINVYHEIGKEEGPDLLGWLPN